MKEINIFQILNPAVFSEKLCPIDWKQTFVEHLQTSGLKKKVAEKNQWLKAKKLPKKLQLKKEKKKKLKTSASGLKQINYFKSQTQQYLKKTCTIGWKKSFEKHYII